MKIVLLESLGIPQQKLDEYASRLEAEGHTFRYFDRTTDTAQLIENIGDADVAIIANMPLKGEVIKACKNLKFIDIAFTGVDHVDLEAARSMGIKVSNAAGYSTEAVAELALCMMISLLRNVKQTEDRCRNGKTKDDLVGSELKGKTVGIVGAGAIGTRVAELCHAFGCRILANKRHVRGDEPQYITFTGLDELLAQADIVTLHCPLTDQTRNLINKDKIELMKQGAILINTARGPVADSEAVAQALRSGHLAGAGIDVFESEPPIAADHPLLGCPNTIVTPHIAFASHESMLARAEIVFDNIYKWMKGEQANIIL